MMEDDTDIYEDLPSIEIKLDENFVANQTESNTCEYAELKKQIAELTVKLEDFRKVNENLEVNLASLLKTAKAEITRKDKMIEDLRKRLDDLMFKRAAHFKMNDRVCKPTFVDNVTIPQQKTNQISSTLNQNKHESEGTDSSYGLTKNSNLSTSSSTSLTVFGERLLKRIAEEQTVEKRGRKQQSRFGSNNGCVPTIGGYLVESDKENSSATDVKPPRTKETQSSAAKEYSEKERFTTTNRLAEERNGTTDASHRFQQKKPMHVTNIANTDEIIDIADGGINGGSDRTMNVKHIKFEVKEHAPRSTNQEMREDDDNNVADEKRDHTKTKRLKCFEKYSNPRYTTYSDTERNRYASVQQQDRKRGRRSFTDSVQTNENDADGRTAKRHCKSAERLSITIDDRRSSSVECRRIKQKEDRHTNKISGDRRSRGRQPFCDSSRDEKYIRNKYDKYRERSIRRYDVSPDSTNGYKGATGKRESRDTRYIEKSEKPARSMSKRHDRSEDNEYRSKGRLRNVDRATRRDKSDNGEKLMNRTRNCETFKSVKANDTNKCFEKSDRRGFTADYETSTTTTTTTNFDDSSQKYQINRKRDSKRMDANEIALDPSICLNNCKKRARSQDRWTNGDKLEPSLISVDVASTNIITRAATTTTTTNAIVTCFATVVSLNEQHCENLGNVEYNETVENVENIEKFIRNYNTNDGNDHANNDPIEEHDTSKPAKEHGSTANHVFNGKTNFEKQRDTIRLNHVKSTETNTKLKAVELNDALQQVVQDSTRNDIEENETTTVPSLVENAKSNKALECNYLVDLTADDKASFNARTEEGLSNSNRTCNISSGSAFQISKPGCNDDNDDDGNVDVDGDGDGKNKDKDKGTDTNTNNVKACRINVSGDVDVDKTNSNCGFSVPRIANGNDDDHDRDHERHGEINVQKETIEKDDKTVRKKKETSKEEDGANLAEKTDIKLGNEEGKVNKEKKENSKDVTEQSLRGTEKSSINCDGIKRKNTSTNIHGKVIVFARRKKPVCLVNSNANMTVLINNNQNLNHS